MNALYADFLHDIRARRAKVGKRGALMDQALDQAENEAKKMDGLTYSDHELYFLGGTLTEVNTVPFPRATPMLTTVQAEATPPPA